MYISINYRPNIQFSVHQCARFTHNTSRSYAEAVKSICRYLVGIQGQVFTFDTNSDIKLDCYADAYFEGLFKHEDDQDPVCVKSSTGYVMNLGGCTLHWLSTLQTWIDLSNLESECIALSQDMRDLLPLR